ncbi:DUF2335 domain-containing protein [Corynebacterium hylobatis]|nr:DUF2335 domain-containing protein [Corynebacterium hylobatis]
MQVTRIAPLPEPRELAQYDQITPGLADRIVRMAESSTEAANAATRSNAEVNFAIAASIREDGTAVRRGQWMVTALAVIGNTPFAIAMGILGCLSVFGVLVRPVNSARWRPGSRDETPGEIE